MPTVDKNGRPDYAQIEDLQPRLDEKNADLTARLRMIEKQNDEALARFGPAPEPKTSKAK